MRSYALTDLEEMSDLSRRTISDYVAKGLLSGPSHRGRGARYPQRDLDALIAIPRLRTILKHEFPNLSAVRAFLHELSTADLHHLARLTNERSFETEVRRLRVLIRLKSFMPTVPPEDLKLAISRLTPEQVRGVDLGHFQISSALDFDRLATSRLDTELAQSGRDTDDPNGAGTHDLPDVSDWERFGSSSVEIRIDKAALRSHERSSRIPSAIRDFAARLEEMIKAAT